MYKTEHPMKPFRVRMTNELICAYGMDKLMKRMEIEPEYIENIDLTLYHSDDYIDVLKNITLENKDLYLDQINRCKLFQSLSLNLQSTSGKTAQSSMGCTTTARYTRRGACEQPLGLPKGMRILL